MPASSKIAACGSDGPPIRRVLAIGDRFAPAASDPVAAERLTVVASRAGLRKLSAEALG